MQDSRNSTRYIIILRNRFETGHSLSSAAYCDSLLSMQTCVLFKCSKCVFDETEDDVLRQMSGHAVID